MTRFLPLDDPAALLAALGKEPDLVPYGGGNFGFPLDRLEPAGETIVPTERFFLRSNGPVPEIDPAAWRLEVSGHVERPFSLTLAELQAMPTRTFVSVLECAGNGRTGFDPIPEGTPWKHDAAGNAEWTGVPLAAVLDRAGVKDGAVDIVAQGGDFPEMRRGLPLPAALDPDTLLAFRMNGAPLGVGHGAPVRLLATGWAGIASTKWLVGIEVLDRAFDGHWNTDNYVIWSKDREALRPVQVMQPRAVISAPVEGQAVPAGDLAVSGYAWSGNGAVRRVEVSVDGGATWQDAAFAPQPRRSWVRWSASLPIPAGEVTVMARATDERRVSQPMQAEWNLKGYQQNSVHRVKVNGA